MSDPTPTPVPMGADEIHMQIARLKPEQKEHVVDYIVAVVLAANPEVAQRISAVCNVHLRCHKG